MPFIIARALTAVLFSCVATAATAQLQQPQDRTSAELVELLPYLNDDDLVLSAKAGQSSSCSVQLLTNALLYRRDPDEHRNALFASLVIDDYADRAAGRYNFVDPETIAATIDASMVAPEGITDNRVKAVIGFCTLKDKNLWVLTEKAGPISLARVVRGIALHALLEGTNEDSLAITNAIDAHTAASHSSLRQ